LRQAGVAHRAAPVLIQGKEVSASFSEEKEAKRLSGFIAWGFGN
jgi:hypothetical protein